VLNSIKLSESCGGGVVGREGGDESALGKYWGKKHK